VKPRYKEVGGNTNHDNNKQKMADLFSAVKRNSASQYQLEQQDWKSRF